jgi:hypothetical protein
MTNAETGDAEIRLNACLRWILTETAREKKYYALPKFFLFLGLKYIKTFK